MNESQFELDHSISREDLLQNISKFTDWGGQSWTHLTRHALSKVGSLESKQILEIGSRFGKMSGLFALLGAQVTALETDASAIPLAQKLADDWGVSSRISFLHYDGDLSHCAALKGRQFDIIFSKSVLVLLCDGLPRFLQGLNELLVSDGRYIFLENAYGGKIFGLMRCLRYRQWHIRGIEYFTRFHLQLVSQILGIEEVKKVVSPPDLPHCGSQAIRRFSAMSSFSSLSS